MLSDNWMSEFHLNPSFSNCTILSSRTKDSLPLFKSLYWFLWWLTNQTSFRILAYFWGTSQYPHCCLNLIRYENYSFQEMPSVDCFSEFHLNPSFYNCAILSPLTNKTSLFFNSIYWLLWNFTHWQRFGFFARFWGTPQCPQWCLNLIYSESCSFPALLSVNWLAKFHRNPSIYNCDILS